MPRIFKESPHFIFQKILFGRYQYLVDMYSVSCVQMTDERWYLQSDLVSKLTIVSAVCLTMTLYTS
jgi:hypothetical protein